MISEKMKCVDSGAGAWEGLPNARELETSPQESFIQQYLKGQKEIFHAERHFTKRDSLGVQNHEVGNDCGQFG